MNAQQLKNSILQMAVQGKLVPQDPNDEPASVLLERIRAEKEKLIKEGKIKKEKNPSYIFRGEDNLPYEKIGKNDPVCIADEVPFEIPDSWEWARLNSICTKLVDGDHNPPKGVDIKTEYIMASSTNINNDTIVDLEKVRYLTKDIFLKENERTNATQGDIFFTSVGSLGRSCIYDGSLNICFQRSVSVITTLLYNQYLKVFLDCGYFQAKVMKEATGTAQKGFYLNQLACSLIPVPPLNEQRRIVEEVRKYTPFISEYDTKKTELDRLNEGFPELLRKSILQQAVMGKLVPQNPDDEPASVLLERIRAEKHALIKAGKLKENKHESIIYRRDNSHYEKLDGGERCIDDEIPFEIPDNWEWVRLGNIINLQSGQDLTPDKYNDKCKGIPYITGASNIEDATVLINRWTEYGRAFAYRGDLLLTCKGTVGTMAFLNENQVHIARQIMSIHPYDDIDAKYVRIVLETLVEGLKAAAKSMIPGISREDVLTALFPLPPLNEQRRIAEMIDIVSDPIGNL